MTLRIGALLALTILLLAGACDTLGSTPGIAARPAPGAPDTGEDGGGGGY